MSEVLPSQKSDLLSILIRAALVGMLVQPETVPTEGSDEFVCPTGSPWLYIQSEALQDIAFHLPRSESGPKARKTNCFRFDVGRRRGAGGPRRDEHRERRGYLVRPLVSGRGLVVSLRICGRNRETARYLLRNETDRGWSWIDAGDTVGHLICCDSSSSP
jgi:hypothetical protein